MKTGMRRRLTAIVLCISMVAATFGANGSVVLAADNTDLMNENETVITDAEMLNETGSIEQTVSPETESVQTENETVQIETETILPESESVQTEEASSESEIETEAQAETETQIESETLKETELQGSSETESETQTVTESESEINNQNNFQFEDETVTVNVELKDAKAVPNGAQLMVKQIQNIELTAASSDDEKAEKASYDNINALLKDKAVTEETPVDGFFAYHIEFVKDGESIEVKAEDMKVSINFKQAVLPEVFQNEDSNLKAKHANLFHFVQDITGAGKTDVVDMKDDALSIKYVQAAEGAETEMAVESVEFTADSLNDYAIAWNGEDTTTEYTYEDEQVIVKAVLSEAGILPRGAVLRAEPVEDKKKLKEVEEQLKQQADDEETIDGFLAYDIRFEKDGEEVEPAGQVSVSMNFKEAVKPETEVKTVKAADEKASEEDVTEVAVYHFKETDNKVNVEKIDDAQLERNSGAQVSAAEFTVDSFSIFTLTWSNKSGIGQSNITSEIKIHLVDKDGNELVTEDFELKKETTTNYPAGLPHEISQWLIDSNEKAKDALKNLDFIRAYLTSKDFTGKKDVKKVNLWMNTNDNNLAGWQVDFTDGTPTRNLTKTDELYFEYGKIEPLETVNTVDSISKGITLNMFDYQSGPQFSGGFWGGDTYGRGVKQGMVSSRLGDDGYPVFTDRYGVQKNGTGESLSGVSLKEWFDPTGIHSAQVNANNLFLESVYNDSKYFYYSSFDNFARLIQPGNQLPGETVGDFRVYKQIGTPNNGGVSFYQRGNFMPYNNIEKGKLSTNKNYYDESGNALSETDPRYGENIYITQGNNYYFGMSMDAAFAQPADGLVNKNPMLFEFNGDDDMWVFIDGVLVLDIGGCHDARSGSINFKDGTIKVQGVADTDLRTVYQNAGADTSLFKEGTNYFRDYTPHTINVFYMERGAGASNLKLKFNIPTVPKGSVNITKNITNINDGAYSDVNFNFKMYIEDKDGTVTREGDDSKYRLVNNEEFTLIDSDGNSESQTQTGDDGTFTLKHGQTAQFLNFDAGKKYFVEETGVEQSKYDEFAVNGSSLTAENGDVLPSEEGDGTFIIRSKPLFVGTDLTVSFQNTCAGTNLKELVIKKELAKGQSSLDSYEITVFVGGQLFKGGFYRNGASAEGSMETTSNGKITLKASDSIRIPKIPSGTSFEVKETNLENLNKDYTKYDREQYAVVNADSINTDGKASGVLIYDHNAQVTVTNTMLSGSLTIEKKIDTANYNNGDPIFTFQIDRKDKAGNIVETMYRTIRFTETENVTSKKVILENLKLGEYVVTELKTIRYECSPSGSEVQNASLTKTAPDALVNYYNIRTNGDNYSHTDMVVNHFEVVDGKIVITQNKQTDASSN